MPYNPDLPDAIICDFDGTISQMHNRGPFEWDKVGQDKPKQDIINILEVYKLRDQVKILIVSGRDESCRVASEEWLRKYDVPYDAFFMRPKGNKLADVIIKRDIYDEFIAKRYNILFVLDDRNQTVAEWRSIGLTCLQVAPGDF